MGKSSTTKASAVFNFRADLEITCFDDNFEIEVEQTALQIDQTGTDVYASFEALAIMTDLKDQNNKAHIRIDVRRARLFSLEKTYSFNASSDSVTVEKITSEDEEVRRRFYDVIDDWTEFDLNVCAVD